LPKEYFMPYTVAYLGGSIPRHEFDSYIRLLEQRKIDWTKAPRVEEPSPGHRWLYVWEHQQDAEEFSESLRSDTGTDKWHVHQLEPNSEITVGPLAPVMIHMRRESLGATFSLHPHSRRLVLRWFPKARPVTSVSIEYGTLFDFEQSHGPVWDHVALVLTGLTSDQLAQIGGYLIFDLLQEKTVFESQAPTRLPA
jgi:hypothetical protein